MLAILMVATIFALLNNSLMNIALPTIMKDFGIDAATVQWLSNGYMLVNGILIPISAFLIQRYSIRQLFLTALGLFTLGTAVGAFAPSFPVILAARMPQAAGAAVMMPLLMNVFFTSFPPAKRGTAMGYFGLAFMFAPAVGPTLSGWIIQHYAWPMLFQMILPFVVILFIAGLITLRDDKVYQKASTLDMLSVILSALGFGGVLFGISTAGSEGWSSSTVWITLAVGIVLVAAFIFRQLRLKEPMLDFRVYTHPMYALSSAISVTLSMSMYCGMILMPIYLQNLRGISAFESGLLMLPAALVMAVMSPVTGKIFDKHGMKILAYTGLSIVIITTYFFSTLGDSTPYGLLIAVFSIRSIGLSMIMMPIQTYGLNTVQKQLIPHATAMNSTLAQLSGAIGVSIFVAIMSNRTASHAAEMLQNALGSLPTTPTAEALASLKQSIGMHAMIAGINDAFFVATGVAFLALILAFFLKGKSKVTAPVIKTEGVTNDA
jgi:EmrB/QacA subfamily drug resistance transporter